MGPLRLYLGSVLGREKFSTVELGGIMNKLKILIAEKHLTVS